MNEATGQEPKKEDASGPLQAPTASHKCAKCGSTKVQCAMWVNPNTNEIIDDYGSWDETDTKWCEECGEHTPILTE